MNSGLRLWSRARECMPGGNGLLSKRPERYAPGVWPVYFSKAKGVEVWDLEGRKFIDMAQMGLGSAILGYADIDVDRAVKQAVDKGINTTLNAPEEVELAELLLELNPFAGGVRFTRSGGEAMSMAVRIARAYSQKDKVAFSGYHGWSDWYLAANLGGEANLREHLLPGLKPKGVPVGLKGTAVPFKYNDTEDFLRVMDKHKDIGVIVFEGARYDFPRDDFLRAIQETAKKNGIITIVDEITSGWRMTDGGVYKVNGFKPDIVVYGKAMGNGFAISAVVGKQKVMAAAQDTFISSTFWTERVGFVAALKTLEILNKARGWEHLNKIGGIIGDGWRMLAQRNGLRLKVTEFKPLITFKLEHGGLNDALYTLFTREMLKRGYLASNSVYVSCAHSRPVVYKYLAEVDEVFVFLARVLKKNNVLKSLKGAVRTDAFKRLT